MMIRPIDPRGRLAVDLYNWGIGRGLASLDDDAVLLDAGTKLLPFGEMTLTVEPSQFLWGGYRFIRFIPVGEFVVRGLSNRYRQAGVGAALAGGSRGGRIRCRRRDCSQTHPAANQNSRNGLCPLRRAAARAYRRQDSGAN